MDWLAPVKAAFEFILPFLDGVPLIRAILGFALMFFLPGFAWSFVFFSRIKVLERVLVSFALSIALVTLSLLFANWLLKVSVTATNSALIIILITILPPVILYLLRYVRRKTGKAEETTEDTDEDNGAEMVGDD